MGDRRVAILQFNDAVRQNQGAKSGAGGDVNLAYQLHSSAVMADDTFGMGWHELGNVVGDLSHSAASIAAHRRALELPDGETPGDLNPAARAKSLVNLGHRLHVLGRNEEGMRAILQAIQMDNRIPQAWCCLSLCLSIEGKHERAVAAARRGLDLEPDNATIETALALALMFNGNMRDGLKHYEARFRYKLRHFLSFPYPQWHGEEGKTVWLVADQGLGDTLSFARFVPQAAARAKFLYLGVQKELVRLFRASFQRIPNIEIIPMPAPFPPADCWATFVSLPTALGLSEDEIRNCPHIDVPQFSVGMNWKSPDRRFHIGVAWRGSTLSDIDHHRSFPVEHLLRLYEVPGVQLYSLQVGEKANELHQAGAAALIRDLSPFINDVADTTAIIRNLDLIVTVESALGHVASACEAQCWIPYSRLGRDYRASADGTAPIWSPRHRFFRQHENRQWDDVFTDIVDALREKVK